MIYWLAVVARHSQTIFMEKKIVLALIQPCPHGVVSDWSRTFNILLQHLISVMMILFLFVAVSVRIDSTELGGNLCFICDVLVFISKGIICPVT